MNKIKIYKIKWDKINSCYIYKDINNNEINYIDSKCKNKNNDFKNIFKKWLDKYISNQKEIINDDILNLFKDYSIEDLSTSLIQNKLKENNLNSYYKSISSIYFKLRNKEFIIDELLYNKLILLSSILFNNIEINFKINLRFIFIKLLLLLNEKILSNSIPRLKTEMRHLININFWNNIKNNISDDMLNNIILIKNKDELNKLI